MAQNVSNAMYFKAQLVCKIPPRGGGGGRKVFCAGGGGCVAGRGGGAAGRDKRVSGSGTNIRVDSDRISL